VKKKNKNEYITGYISLSLFFFFLLIPIFWIIFSSFKEPQFVISRNLWPGWKGFTYLNYIKTLSQEDFQLCTMNSIRISIGTALLTLLISSLASYSSSRFRFRFGAPILIPLLSQMLPPVLFLIPFFLLMVRLKLLDSTFGLILTHTLLALPFSIWMLKGYFDSIPKDLDEMGMIDGCNRLGVLFRIVFPLSAPGLAVVAFFSFITSWGDYMFVSVLSQSKATTTLTILLQSFISGGAGRRIQWEILSSATVLVLLPTVVLFALLQRWFISGLTSGAVKE